MKIHAYILAADPAWLEPSIGSYYELVDRIVVSYDRHGRGYTGKPVDIDSCLKRLRACDPAGKMVYSPGDYGRSGFTPMENETHQRREALKEAGREADWVLQLDTDEVLPIPSALLETLAEAERQGIEAVEWPMRVLFQRMRDGRFLEICGKLGEDRFEYPGAIAVRPAVTLTDGRRAEGRFMRPVVVNDDCSFQVRATPVETEIRYKALNANCAILHNSWAREPANIRNKLSTWSHSRDQRSWLGFYIKWSVSRFFWRRMHDFHPRA